MARAYVNARVYTMKNEGDTVEAFIIEDGKFFFCGSSDEAMRLIRAGRESGIWPDAEIVDLHGKCVLPGPPHANSTGNAPPIYVPNIGMNCETTPQNSANGSQ